MGGSTAFANPTATMLRDPVGRDALLVTLFLPTEGAAPGEAGSLLYLGPVGQAAQPPARARWSAPHGRPAPRVGLGPATVDQQVHGSPKSEA